MEPEFAHEISPGKETPPEAFGYTPVVSGTHPPLDSQDAARPRDVVLPDKVQFTFRMSIAVSLWIKAITEVLMESNELGVDVEDIKKSYVYLSIGVVAISLITGSLLHKVIKTDKAQAKVLAFFDSSSILTVAALALSVNQSFAAELSWLIFSSMATVVYGVYLSKTAVSVLGGRERKDYEDLILALYSADQDNNGHMSRVESFFHAVRAGLGHGVGNLMPTLWALNRAMHEGNSTEVSPTEYMVVLSSFIAFAAAVACTLNLKNQPALPTTSDVPLVDYRVKHFKRLDDIVGLFGFLRDVGIISWGILGFISTAADMHCLSTLGNNTNTTSSDLDCDNFIHDSSEGALIAMYVVVVMCSASIASNTFKQTNLIISRADFQSLVGVKNQLSDARARLGTAYDEASLTDILTWPARKAYSGVSSVGGFFHRSMKNCCEKSTEAERLSLLSIEL